MAIKTGEKRGGTYLGISSNSKPCDCCRASASVLFCRADAVFLCRGCDARAHSANGLASRHERAWLCEVCEHAPAAVTCKADAASLCAACDSDIHSANPLARRHERLPLLPFLGPAPQPPATAAAGSRGAGSPLLHPENDEAADAETAAASLLPHEGPVLRSAAEFFFSDTDAFLDLDYGSSMDGNKNGSGEILRPSSPLIAAILIATSSVRNQKQRIPCATASRRRRRQWCRKCRSLRHWQGYDVILRGWIGRRG